MSDEAALEERCPLLSVPPFPWVGLPCVMSKDHPGICEVDLAAVMACMKAEAAGRAEGRAEAEHLAAELDRVAVQLGVVRSPDIDLAECARVMAGHALNAHRELEQMRVEVAALRLVRDAAEAYLAADEDDVDDERWQRAEEALCTALDACPRPASGEIKP
jgi:hypothetical protein